MSHGLEATHVNYITSVLVSSIYFYVALQYILLKLISMQCVQHNYMPTLAISISIQCEQHNYKLLPLMNSVLIQYAIQWRLYGWAYTGHWPTQFCVEPTQFIGPPSFVFGPPSFYVWPSQCLAHPVFSCPTNLFY